MRAGIAHRRVDSFEDTVAVGGYYERRTRAFFYIGFALIFINRVIAQIATNLNLGFLEELPLMPVALCILFIRYAGLMFGASARRVGLSLLFLFLSFVSFIKSGQSYLPTACLLLCGVGEVNIRKVIEVTSICALLLIALLLTVISPAAVSAEETDKTVVRVGLFKDTYHKVNEKGELYGYE